jgi:hypothetical protein
MLTNTSQNFADEDDGKGDNQIKLRIAYFLICIILLDCQYLNFQARFNGRSPISRLGGILLTLTINLTFSKRSVFLFTTTSVDGLYKTKLQKWKF